jgi:hypothetical protein
MSGGPRQDRLAEIQAAVEAEVEKWAFATPGEDHRSIHRAIRDAFERLRAASPPETPQVEIVARCLNNPPHGHDYVQAKKILAALQAQIPNQRAVEEAYRKAGEVSQADLNYEVRGASQPGGTPSVPAPTPSEMRMEIQTATEWFRQARVAASGSCICPDAPCGEGPCVSLRGRPEPEGERLTEVQQAATDVIDAFKTGQIGHSTDAALRALGRLRAALRDAPPQTEIPSNLSHVVAPDDEIDETSRGLDAG